MASGPNHPLTPLFRLLGFLLFLGVLVYGIQVFASPAEKRPGALCMPWYRATVLVRQDIPHYFAPNHPEWQSPFAGRHFYEGCVAWSSGLPGFHPAG